MPNNHKCPPFSPESATKLWYGPCFLQYFIAPEVISAVIHLQILLLKKSHTIAFFQWSVLCQLLILVCTSTLLYIENTCSYIFITSCIMGIKKLFLYISVLDRKPELCHNNLTRALRRVLCMMIYVTKLSFAVFWEVF